MGEGEGVACLRTLCTHFALQNSDLPPTAASKTSLYVHSVEQTPLNLDKHLWPIILGTH